MADEPEPASFLNDRPPLSLARAAAIAQQQQKSAAVAADASSRARKRKRADSPPHSPSDAEARSIVNQKMRAPRRMPNNNNKQQQPHGQQPGLFAFEDDDPSGVAAAPVRPFAPPPSLNDLVPAVVPSCFKEEEWLQDLEQEEKERKAAGEPKPFCYLCKLGQEANDEEDNPFYSRLEEEWIKNYGNMHDIELCELIQAMYNKDNRPFVKAGPTWDARPDWALSTIYRHFTEHSVNDMVSNRWVKTQYQRMMGLIARSGLVELETATGVRRVNLKAMKAFMDIDKRRQSLVVTNAIAGSGGGGGGGGGGAPLTSSRSSAKVS